MIYAKILISNIIAAVFMIMILEIGIRVYTDSRIRLCENFLVKSFGMDSTIRS